MNIKMSEDMRKSILQFVRFGVVGVSNTLVSLVIFDAALYLFRRFLMFGRYDYLAAQVVMFMLSILWSFYWNNRFVFTDQTGTTSLWLKLAKTYVTYSFTGIMLSSVLLYFWVDILGISPYVAPVINSVINLPVNFFINKYWSFA